MNMKNRLTNGLTIVNDQAKGITVAFVFGDFTRLQQQVSQ